MLLSRPTTRCSHLRCPKIHHEATLYDEETRHIIIKETIFQEDRNRGGRANRRRLFSPVQGICRSTDIWLFHRRKFRSGSFAVLCVDFSLKIISASIICLIGLTLFLCMGTFAPAQSTTFKARLSPVSMDASMRSTVAGSGSVSAHLTSSKLLINGSFEGLLSPATVVQVRESTVTGVRGPAIFNLTITKATSGTISGSIDLTPEQVEALRKGRFYVQIDSEKAPEGNLWGWLLP